MKEKFRILWTILVITGFSVTMVYPVAAAPSQADLVITSVSAPYTAITGENITVSAIMMNIGSIYSSYIYTNFYLSKNKNIDSSDAYLGRGFSSYIDPGRSKTVAISVTIPSGSLGEYYIIARADGLNQTSETNEFNNDRSSSKMSITSANNPSSKPDLVISAMTAPSSAVPGRQVSVSATVKNIGSSAASDSYINFYLSKDSVKDASDQYMGSTYVSSITASSSRTVSYSGTIPLGTSGQVYIVSLADGTARITESDETNNAGISTPISVQTQSAPTPTPTPTKTPTPTPTLTTIPTTVPTAIPTPIPGETFGAESNPTGNPLGGGAGYNQVYTENDPRVTYIVDTKAEFLNALVSAKAGNVIYIPESANIDLTGVLPAKVPAGITIASNRGVNGSPGGRIFQNRLPTDPKVGGPERTMLYIIGNNVRITGLRLEGPDKNYISLDSLGLGARSGIRVYDRNNLVVDNCELWGWSMGGVDLAFPNGGYAYVHHNYIHHCQNPDLGYAVVLSGGNALVEGNIFDYIKNPVAATGKPGEGYEARYNVVKHAVSKSHQFDVHPYTDPITGQVIAGSTYKIHHNTVMYGNVEAVGIFGVPQGGIWIHHNKFQWTVKESGDTYSPVTQRRGTTGIYMTRNYIANVLYENGPVYYW